MLLKELFDNGVKYTKKSKKQYDFTIGEYVYEVYFQWQDLPKSAQIKLDRTENVKGFEVEFLLKTDDARGKEFGISNTGNELKVFSTVLDIIKTFLSDNKPEFFYLSAEEPSRQKLYDRMSKIIESKLKYKLFHTLKNNYGKGYVFQIK